MAELTIAFFVTHMGHELDFTISENEIEIKSVYFQQIIAGQRQTKYNTSANLAEIVRLFKICGLSTAELRSKDRMYRECEKLIIKTVKALATYNRM